MLNAQTLRTWTGSVNNDFNNSGNWSPTGALSTNDSCVINITSTKTITMSSSVTILAIDINVSGTNVVGTFSTGSSVLTLNNTGRFDVLSGNNNTTLRVDVNGSGSGIVFGGEAIIGNSSVKNVLFESNTSNPGYLKFMSDVIIGAYGRTSPATEPDIIFDKNGTQTLYENGAVTYFLGESLTFGQTNTPTVYISGANPNWFGLYNGAMTVKAGATVVGGGCGFNAYAGSGSTVTLNAGCYVSVGTTNNFPGPFSTYNLDATSTFEYNGTSQSVTAIGGTGYGNLIINSSTAGTSAGSFSIRGDFTNTQGWSHGYDIHTFNGTAAQSINGTKPLFYYVIVNKSSGTLTMNTDVDCEGRVVLTSGPVDLNNNTLTLSVNYWGGNGSPDALMRTSGYLISESETSILSWMIRHSGAPHYFAFGNSSGTYIPWSYDVLSGTIGYFDVSTYATGTNNTPWATGVTAMYDPTLGKDGSVEAVIDRWWVLTNASSNTGNVIFTYAGSENTMQSPYNVGSLGAQRWNGSKWDSPLGSGTGVTSGTGTVSISSLSSFSPWVISSQSAPLPVELLNFEATPSGEVVNLNWSTASEINNELFEVERSADGETWEKITEVPGSGNSRVIRHYSAVDNQPLSGANYYRLKQIDIDGAFEYSDVVMANIALPTEVQIVPNPVKGMAFATFSAESSGQYTISIYNTAGQQVLSTQGMYVKGQNNVQVNTHDLGAGMYIVKLLTNGKSITGNLVVEE